MSVLRFRYILCFLIFNLVLVGKALAIVNGTVVGPKEALATAAIVITDSLHNDVYCSAVAIGQQKLLTAGHCFTEPGLLDKHIRLNTAKFPFSSELDKMQVSFDKVKLIADVDLAIIELDEPIPANYQAFAIDQSFVLSKEMTLIITGFGRTQPSQASDQILRTAEIHPGSFNITATLIEAYLDWPEANVCKGDSGGPVFVKQNGRLVLVGLAIRSDDGCDASADFIILTAFADYIQLESDPPFVFRD